MTHSHHFGRVDHCHVVIRQDQLTTCVITKAKGIAARKFKSYQITTEEQFGVMDEKGERCLPVSGGGALLAEN